MCPHPDVAEGGIAEHVRKLRLGQAAGAKRLDLGVGARINPRTTRRVARAPPHHRQDTPRAQTPAVRLSPEAGTYP